MRNIALVFTAYVAMLLLGAIWRITPFEVVAPALPVIWAVYLGMTARTKLTQATAAAIVVGYLADLLSGAPRGLNAFVAGSIAVLCRVASTRLLLRGRLFVGLFAAVAALAGALLVLAARAYVGARIGDLGNEAIVALGSAVLTGVIAPACFRLCRTVDAAFARTEREREAMREGYLT